MATEIERKFLVQGDEWPRHNGVRITQGYLARERERSVRVRLAGDRATLTIKAGAGTLKRSEFEYAIPTADAIELLALCTHTIEKTRRVIGVDGTRWEVDEFAGDNEGLVIAEVELESEDQIFNKPSWIGREVTDDTRYLNAELAAHPFRAWKT
ncbi:MAG TPA: CYTH domain-containing protein [Rudaea sp.]|jgi:CYTH domain-containing protein|nr:CYTH domain-containing protein [Rudaea sp.]